MMYIVQCKLYNIYSYYLLISYQLKLIKVRAELPNLNNCAVLFLSLAAVNLSWYDSTYLQRYIIRSISAYTQEKSLMFVQPAVKGLLGRVS